MSQRPTSYTSGQRYKKVMLALEGNPEVEISVTHKRPSNVEGTSNQKKAKEKPTPKCPPFWFGFQAMNWTNRGKNLPMDSHEPTTVLVENGMKESEALECQNVISYFLFVLQEEWPTTREDGRIGQHFHLTQVPSNVEVDDYGLSLDYQVTIHFKI